MQTWMIEASSPRRLVDATAIAALVDAIGSNDPEALANCILVAVRPIARAQQCTVFAHEAQRNPRLLSGAADGGPWAAFRCGAIHAREFATQDALRQLMERKPAAGPIGAVLVVRQRTDEMPMGSYRCDGLEVSGLVDRLTLLVRTGESTWLAAHLYRDVEHGHFDGRDIEALTGVAILLARCIARHYASDVDGLASLRESVSDGVSELGARLTEREREVLTRILDGVTVNRIAEDLNLSPTTVATYRLRAYEKLGVNSRQELFATMLRRRANPVHPASLAPAQRRVVQNHSSLLHAA